MRRLLALGVALFVAPGIGMAHDGRASGSIENYPLDRVSERVYVVHGIHKLPDSDNRGFMNNPGAIFTSNGIVIVDPGSSAEIGKQFLRKLRRVSDKPVIAVINTHVHGDHWLGNHGIREVYPDVPIYAHTRMIDRVKSGEGDDWIKLFTGMTKGAVVGTKVIAPNIGLQGGEILELDGVRLRIHHTGHAHTDHDIMIEVVEDKALFFGDIVNNKEVINSAVPQDANYRGSIAAIKAMLKGPAVVFIPGHGRSGGRELPESALKFLETLTASVEKYYKLGLSDYEMKEKILVEMANYRNWYNFSEMGRVISFVYYEVEKDNF